jgi:methyl-accepting chemotaxis protein
MKINPLIPLVSFLTIILLTACDDTKEPEPVSILDKEIQNTQELACEAIPTKNDIVQLASVFNDSKDLSVSLLQTSKNVLKLSDSLTKAGSLTSPEYVDTTLELSQDILNMAEEIGHMSDKILIMDDTIGKVADKILETQVTQSQNLKSVEENILNAQDKIKLIKFED